MAWEALLTCVAGVSPLLDVASLHEWPWSSFPQARNLRPLKEFFDDVMVALRESLRPPPPVRVQQGFVTGDAAPAKRLRPEAVSAANVPSHPVSNPNLASVSGSGTVKPRAGRPAGFGVGARGTTPLRRGVTLRGAGRRARGPWVAR